MSHEEDYSPAAEKCCLIAIGTIIVLYALAAAMGWPQKATELINHAHAAGGDHAAAPLAEATSSENAAEAHAQTEKPEPPAIVAVLPFVLMLGAIAIFPLLPWTEHWWENNLHRFYVAAGLGLVTLAYYAMFHGQPVERHFVWHGLADPEGPFSIVLPWTVLQNALLAEYVPFIILLFSLYTICGGIRIAGDLPAHPFTNTLFIAIGGLLASFIGTTGAAMVLIRPLLETNAERKRIAHTVVFFIFVVCNCGGCLLPIGDPPLFLGYLEGVPFLWTLSLWKEWLFINVGLLVIYWVWDQFFAYPHESQRDRIRDETSTSRLRFGGLIPNVPLLLGVVLAVALLDPSKPIPGTNWHAWLWLREVVQLGLVGISLLMGSRPLRQENRFTFSAIIEVAALFVGIFICMQPALQILDVRGASLGLDTPMKFFWSTGALSSVLDNAPTYLVFFKTAQALQTSGPSVAGVGVDLLAAISLGAVLMGAMTYIGNGPNFMVKSIAEKSGVKMPSFFGYMVYSVGILLPLLIAMQLIFLRS
jgi:Na+/H+ antiporter NhaD/arsenite permease-like protein